MYGKRKQIFPGLMVLVMVGLILLVPFLPASEARRTLKDVDLDEDSYKSYLLISSMDDEVDVNFTVTQGGKVDLYIMTSEMYRDRYQQDLHFNPAMVRENITTARFTWTQPDDSTYYLVIDNWDNGRTTDAKPTGNVTYDLFYDDGFLADLDELFGMAMMMVVACCLLVIIVVVVVIWFLFRKKKDKQGTVVIPPPIAYPPGGQPSYPGVPPSYPQSPQPPYQPPPGFNQQSPQQQQQPPYPQPPAFAQPPPPNYPPPQQQPPYQQSPGYPSPPVMRHPPYEQPMDHPSQSQRHSAMGFGRPPDPPPIGGSGGAGSWTGREASYPQPSDFPQSGARPYGRGATQSRTPMDMPPTPPPGPPGEPPQY